MKTQMFYAMTKNGASIKTHYTLRSAMRQARQWKSSDTNARICVEEYTYSFDTGYVRTGNATDVEIPMLVPELTPRHDWDVELIEY